MPKSELRKSSASSIPHQSQKSVESTKTQHFRLHLAYGKEKNRCCSDCGLVIMAFNVEDQSDDSLKCFPTLPRLQYAASEYQPCWFVSVIRRIHQYMKVVIPAEFSPFIFAPSEMMVTVNNGKCSYIVEVENQQLTKGWYTVALNHKLGKNYTMLFVPFNAMCLSYLFSMKKAPG